MNIPNHVKEDLIKDKECCICLEPLETDTLFVTECWHLFHIECMNDIRKCPICRQRVKPKTKPIVIQEVIQDEVLYDKPKVTLYYTLFSYGSPRVIRYFQAASNLNDEVEWIVKLVVGGDMYIQKEYSSVRSIRLTVGCYFTSIEKILEFSRQ